MSTLIRPELSETNRYWIEKHRYYELKHFCLQYPLWRHAYNSLIDYPCSWPQLVPPCKTNVVSDPITKHIDERMYYADRMKMVEQVAKETDEELSCYILEAILVSFKMAVLHLPPETTTISHKITIHLRHCRGSTFIVRRRISSRR